MYVFRELKGNYPYSVAFFKIVKFREFFHKYKINFQRTYGRLPVKGEDYDMHYAVIE